MQGSLPKFSFVQITLYASDSGTLISQLETDDLIEYIIMRIIKRDNWNQTSGTNFTLSTYLRMDKSSNQLLILN